MTIVLLIAGLVLLVLGADILVRGASQLALSMGITPLVIGLTIVAFGTSAPEMAVSIGAAWEGSADLALGNVVGSNIFNVLFILGLSALIAPLVVAHQLVRLDVPLMILASLLVWLFARNGLIERWEGGVLFLGIILYTGFLIIQSRRDRFGGEADSVNGLVNRSADSGASRRYLVNGFFILSGLVGLVLGSRWLVQSSVEIARYFHVSELVIGLTIVSVGTSLPEVATSVVASIKGERDIAVGNVIGSNLFNLLAVLGLAAAVSPAGISVTGQALQFDIPVMVAVAVICLPIFIVGYRINRFSGLMFLAGYVLYTFALIFKAQAG